MKKYSDKYLKNYKILKKAIIGFEFECYFDISFYKTLELLNKELAPVKVHGFRTYHSDFKVDANNFKLERDLSGGENMAEIITGPLDYYTAKYYMIKILKFIDTYGRTTDKSSIHINISFDGEDLNNINILKTILNVDEESIYKKFPSRKNNVYARSVRNIIPFKDYDFSNVGIETIRNVLHIPDSKYYGINFQHVNKEREQRLEVRYIGGKNYQTQVSDIIEVMDEIIVLTYENIKTGFNDEDIDILNEFLEDRITNFRNLNTYDSFLVEYPNLEIQIDRNNTYEIVSSHYGKLYEKIYNFLDSIENIEEGIINFYTSTNKIEIVGAKFEAINELSNIDFISCDIYGGIFNSSNVYDSKILNSEFNRSKIDKSDVVETKLISCNVEDCDLNNCFFQAGLLNSHMEGGVFRSGKLGQYATFSPTTKIVGKEDKFFGNKKEEETEDKKDKLNKFPE
jgi:uncharacterized protein YjbI with pentapeptide repeats